MARLTTNEINDLRIQLTFCAKMTAAALRASVSFTTSRGYTEVWRNYAALRCTWLQSWRSSETIDRHKVRRATPQTEQNQQRLFLYGKSDGQIQIEFCETQCLRGFTEAGNNRVGVEVNIIYLSNIYMINSQ